MPAFDSISRKTSPLPQTPWPQQRSAPKPPAAKQRQPTPRHRTQIAVAFGIITLFGIGFFLKSNTQQVSAETKTQTTLTQPQALPTPVAFAQAQEADLTTPPLIIDQPTATSIAQPEIVTPEPINTTLPTIRILNGSSIPGAATDMGNKLVSAGYTILSVGDAQFDYVQTTIYFIEGNKEAAQAVATAIGNPSATISENILASPAQVLVVLGGDDH